MRKKKTHQKTHQETQLERYIEPHQKQETERYNGYNYRLIALYNTWHLQLVIFDGQPGILYTLSL